MSPVHPSGGHSGPASNCIMRVGVPALLTVVVLKASVILPVSMLLPCLRSTCMQSSSDARLRDDAEVATVAATWLWHVGPACYWPSAAVAGSFHSPFWPSWTRSTTPQGCH